MVHTNRRVREPVTSMMSLKAGHKNETTNEAEVFPFGKWDIEDLVCLRNDNILNLCDRKEGKEYREV